MKTLDTTKIGKKLLLADGSKIILLDRLASPLTVTDEEVERNIYRLLPTDAVQWQVIADIGVYSRTPFTGMELGDDGVLTAYRWDGTEYKVDVDTGLATPYRLTK